MFSFEIFLSIFFAYFVVVDPLGVALVFNVIQGDRTKKQINLIILKAVIISITLILVFGFFGIKILASLGISIEAFRIAGGLLLFYTAFHMIIDSIDDLDEKQNKDIPQKDISVFPLSIPLLAGPGCLTLSILQFSNLQDTSVEINSMFLAIFGVFILTYLCLFFSSYIKQILGKTINDVLHKIIGVLLASLSVQFIADGILGFIPV